MKKILVVDDEADVRAAIVASLEETELEILEADNGSSAFDVAVFERPDLIITDVIMDNGNGFALTELLKADSRTASIKVIMMTGAAGGAGAWQSGIADRYLQKPFSADVLLEEVSRILEGTSADQPLPCRS